MRTYNSNRKLSTKMLLLTIMFSLLTINTLTTQFTLVAGDIGDDDWTMFRHDPAHIGYSTSTAPTTNQTQWAYTLGDSVDYSSPAIADTALYVGSWDDKLYCFNATTGVFIWSYTTEDDIRSSPAVADGKVYVGSDDNKIYCINASTGAHLWNTTTGDNIRSSPAVVNDRVYVGSIDDNLYCINATTGAFIWSYTTSGNVNSSPAVADGRVYVGSIDNNLYCINASTGAFMWNYLTGSYVLSSPAVADGKVYFGSGDSKLYCLGATTGTHVWTYTALSDVLSSPAVADGKVYVGSDDSKIYCLNANTGAFIWSYTTGDSVYSSPAVANGVVYVGSGDNKIYGFGPLFLWHFDSVFKLNDVHMIYPSTQTPKPLDCAAAMVSDWLSSAFIYTKLENVAEGTDTESAFVNQETGKPTGDTGSSVISFGGPIVNPVVAYAEGDETPTGDRAPIRYYQNEGTCYFQRGDGTSITGANLPVSVINNNMDMFVIETYQDGDGRNILLCYGFGWQGTYAAGKYFDTEIYPNLNSYPYSWTIINWEDTNANGFVNTAADGDTYTVIATG